MRKKEKGVIKKSEQSKTRRHDEIGKHPRLRIDLSAFGETLRVELLKVGETFNMAIPNQAEKSEGVET